MATMVWNTKDNLGGNAVTNEKYCSFLNTYGKWDGRAVGISGVVPLKTIDSPGKYKITASCDHVGKVSLRRMVQNSQMMADEGGIRWSYSSSWETTNTLEVPDCTKTYELLFTVEPSDIAPTSFYVGTTEVQLESDPQQYPTTTMPMNNGIFQILYEASNLVGNAGIANPSSFGMTIEKL